MRADGDDQLGALPVREQESDVLGDPGCRNRLEGHAETAQPLLARGVAFAVGVDQDLGAAPKRVVRDRVHVADDHVGLPALLQQRLGAAVDGHEHRLEVTDVRPDDPEIPLVAGPARDDERVAVSEAGLQRGEVDPLGEQPALLTQVAHRVVRELLKRLRHSTLLCCERTDELALLECPAGGDTRPVPEEAPAANGEPLTVRDLLEELSAGHVDQPDTSANEEERAWVRVSARVRRRDVHDDADARLDQLLGRDAVEIGVVDDRDVVGGQPADELLGPLAESCRAGVFDESAHHGSIISGSR